ncbi:MAG: hypothetical protein P1P90_05715 [Patescibacteria group bacterium]|nr:hypothetical protein [Patescibacteria group bacterium]
MAYSRQYIQQIQEIFSKVSQKSYQSDENITVHAAVGRFAFIYEKIRNAVDYKDEHLIRKAAILRMLKRLLLLERDPRIIAERLIREMIGARYLPNGVMPQTCIDDVSWRIYKLQLIQNVKAGSESHLDWVRGMVAVEIEDLLVDAVKEKALVSFLYDRVHDSIKVSGGQIDPAEVQLQTYLACFRTVIKADDEILGYKMLRAFLPEWLTPQNWMDDPRPIAERLVAVERRIKLQLRHPLSLKFQRVIKPWAVAINMMSSAFDKKPEEVNALLQDPEALKRAVSLVAEERYTKTKAKVRRATIRAMIYLFLTKMIMALILEAPAELFLYSELHYKPLAINLLFPAVLMFIVGLFIRVPGPENTSRIRSAIDELLNEGMPELRVISAPAKRTATAKLMLTLVYMLTFVVSFGLVSLLLDYISFTWISTLIFLFFLSVVSFFAFRIRLNAREYFVIDDKVTLRHSIVDFFSIPILSAGRWLSLSISRINIFLFFFDFIFEAPYKIFLSLLEEWFAFAKEKKDELQP